MPKEEETPSAVGVREQQTQDTAAQAPAVKSKSSEALIGAFVWLVIFAVIGFSVSHGNSADVYLDVSPNDPRLLSGVVLYDGAPVASGRVVLETWDAPQRKLIGSAVIDVTNAGRFETKPDDLPAAIDSKQPLRIVATYAGTTNPDKPGEKPKELSGDCTLHLNQSPPVSMGVIVTFGVLLAALLGALVWLFTLELTQGRARTLFRLPYIVILVALSVPIVLIAIAARSEQVVNAMEQAPVGLVKGQSEAVKKPNRRIDRHSGSIQHGNLPHARPRVDELDHGETCRHGQCRLQCAHQRRCCTGLGTMRRQRERRDVRRDSPDSNEER